MPRKRVKKHNLSSITGITSTEFFYHLINFDTQSKCEMNFCIALTRIIFLQQILTNKFKLMKTISKLFIVTTGLCLSISFSADAQWGTSGTNIYNTNTGFVGIGTGTAFTPSEKLDVKGNIRLNDNTFYLRLVGDNNHGLGYRGIVPFGGQTIDGPVLFGWGGGALGVTSGTPKMVLRWDATGNVGIGTPGAAAEALQIGDRFVLHNAGFKGIAYNFTYNGGDKRLAADFCSGLFFTNTGTIILRTAPSGAAGSAIVWQPNVVTIGNDGKMLIGNPALANFKGTPGNYLLYVQQGILTDRLKVAVNTSTDWADYVFADQYKLKSISDLEAFIKVNKHLPNVPAADEMVNEGLDVAKMDAKLLEKIEELTLYVIQQQKEIELLKSKK
jgi:hypothetical protein